MDTIIKKNNCTHKIFQMLIIVMIQMLYECVHRYFANEYRVSLAYRITAFESNVYNGLHSILSILHSFFLRALLF